MSLKIFYSQKKKKISLKQGKTIYGSQGYENILQGYENILRNNHCH